MTYLEALKKLRDDQIVKVTAFKIDYRYYTRMMIARPNDSTLARAVMETRQNIENSQEVLKTIDLMITEEEKTHA